MFKLSPVNKQNEQGFTYVDVLCAIVILMVGILGAIAALTANLVHALESDKRIVAKQLALSTIEAISSARDIRRADGIAGWESIGNEGTNVIEGIARGIFLNGWKPIREDNGKDGVPGTADDACDASGPCAVGGYANASVIDAEMERQITITDIPDPERPSPPHAVARRRIDVTVRYKVRNLNREITLSTIVTNY